MPSESQESQEDVEYFLQEMKNLRSLLFNLRHKIECRNFQAAEEVLSKARTQLVITLVRGLDLPLPAMRKYKPALLALTKLKL